MKKQQRKSIKTKADILKRLIKLRNFQLSDQEKKKKHTED